MDNKKNLTEKISTILGNDFKYHATNIINNCSTLEPEFQYIHFIFTPKNIKQRDKQLFFEQKIEELKLNYPHYEIFGGYVIWFGHMLTIKIDLLHQKQIYKQNMEYFYKQCEIVNSTNGV